MHKFYSDFDISNINTWLDLSFDQAISLIKNMNKKNKNKNQTTNHLFNKDKFNIHMMGKKQQTITCKQFWNF